MTTKVQNIGLAAYIRMRGHKLKKVDPHGFVFELSQNEQEELQMEYYNGECSRHDSEVCHLRDLQRAVRETR